MYSRQLFTHIPVRDHVFVGYSNTVFKEASSVVLYQDVPVDKAAIHIVTWYVEP